MAMRPGTARTWSAAYGGEAQVLLRNSARCGPILPVIVRRN
jgi:hypothetical protein